MTPFAYNHLQALLTIINIMFYNIKCQIFVCKDLTLASRKNLFVRSKQHLNTKYKVVGFHNKTLSKLYTVQ